MLMKKCPRCAAGLAAFAVFCTCEEALRLAEPETLVTLYTAGDQPHIHDDGPHGPQPTSRLTIRAVTASSSLSMQSSDWRDSAGLDLLIGQAVLEPNLDLGIELSAVARGASIARPAPWR